MSSVRYYTSKELKESPSRKDGIDEAKEAGYRKQMLQFGQRMRQELKLPEHTQFTAVVYCDRFFALRSHAKNDRFLITAAAIFLAAKATDSPRPVGHVAQAYYRVKNANKQQELAAMAKDPVRKVAELNLAESIMIGERALLYTLNFHVKVDIPLWTSGFFKNQLATVGLYLGNKDPQGVTLTDKQKHATQVAINFANDSFRKTTLPVQYPAEKIIAASIICAAREAKVELPVPGTKSLYEHFDISLEEVEDFHSQLMDLFVRKPTADTGEGAAAAAAAPGAQAGASNAAGASSHVSNKQQAQPAAISQQPAVSSAGAQAPAAGAGTSAPPVITHAASLEEGELLEGGAQQAAAAAAAAGDAGAGEAGVAGRPHLEDSAHDGAVAAEPSGDSRAQEAGTSAPHAKQEQVQHAGVLPAAGAIHSGGQDELLANKKRLRDEGQLSDSDMSGHAKVVRVA
mmetsp:Transcript_325/g.828  ORF Transcript_325/g.828 Transcript_325/m.828 type:complete len:457 (-) Transcript_325:317-1687(-)|eukprot:CAMPEP_0202869732 /NCGR_PEP_ID=MMETSP1391-20130828/12615_1 /ASSEMBLY_ACC=CAM_ASM_000867 /TAXON_ID=1034604 /ORGANISM="Chlamydomonas leiostraca, Strain SAG 11-49" /LENGTH=456 /DNA_ID=CAMNT_0049550081 /DNA_START=164 /DNA_END=1534 /DNA_ORIENTATION=+